MKITHVSGVTPDTTTFEPCVMATRQVPLRPLQHQITREQRALDLLAEWERAFDAYALTHNKP